MDASEYLVIEGKLAVFRPAGRVSLDQAVAMVTAALTLARARGARTLLAVTSALTGFPPPTVAERWFLVRKWADAAGGLVRLAVVARPEMIDPFRFGVTVARNNGLDADVFVSEDEALVWLRGE